ncbi:hypothetical protein [Arthrobacter sp. ES3-54]|uniref:hypothetical protein n=1 Tax=Arthrobacter sp. ES3-54 TaxID=1502991 RepID=UPI0024066DBC|nr:hypothetical protein [Arthrobacter sp. ES3-54]
MSENQVTPQDATPRRVNNHATGYPYSKRDHTQQWLMPDGSREYTWWIEPGDTSTLDAHIEHRREQIAKSEAAIALYESLRAGVIAERVSFGCPNCGRPELEGASHCTNPRCGHIECACSRVYPIEPLPRG